MYILLAGFLGRIRLILVAAVALTFALSSMTQATGFVDLKFGQYQVADSQWNTARCSTTDTCEITSKIPGVAYKIPFSNGTVNWGTSRYIAFIPNTAPDSSTNPLVMALYEADGTLVETLGTGRVLTAGAATDGNSFFFFVGSDNFTGQLFSGSLGMDSKSGVTFTGTLNPTLDQLNTFSTNLSTAPLAEGQKYSLPSAPPPTTDPNTASIEAPQSVLERVLGQIDGATNLGRVNGTFANIAENMAMVDPQTGKTLNNIDGSIRNVVTGVRAATADALWGVASATESVTPRIDFGDMATTALGAVNTGEITLGVNVALDEASVLTPRGLSAVTTQIGGSADTGALVLNVASNALAVTGSIENVMLAVHGSTGNLSTTALGAVNTGTIISGVNSALQGIVGMQRRF